MKICFFGASVTEQHYNSGYVIQFKNTVEKNNIKNLEIVQKGFGSMHLCNIAISKIDEIINDKTNCIFIDWFSTWYIETDVNELNKLLDSIIRKLMLIKCNICFLLFDRIDMCENRLKMYENIINYANKHCIHYISMYNNENVKELIRDDVHTNEIGANYYSTIIYNYFINKMYHISNISYNNIPNENEYSFVKTMKINKIFYDKFVLIGNFKLIGLFQKVGRSSGIVNIRINDLDKLSFNIWDTWCYYDRNSIRIDKLHMPIFKNYINKIEIEVTQNNFDTSLAKKNIDFTVYKKNLDIIEIFYLGELNMG